MKNILYRSFPLHLLFNMERIYSLVACETRIQPYFCPKWYKAVPCHHGENETPLGIGFQCEVLLHRSKADERWGRARQLSVLPMSCDTAGRSSGIPLPRRRPLPPAPRSLRATLGSSGPSICSRAGLTLTGQRCPRVQRASTGQVGTAACAREGVGTGTLECAPASATAAHCSAGVFSCGS